MHFLDFEQPLEELYKILEDLQKSQHISSEVKAESIQLIESRIEDTRKKLYENLTPWQRVQVARHPERPYTLYYIEQICSSFTELHGDRNFKDDKAIVGGLGIIDGQTVMIIGHQKGSDIKSRQYRNFGMPHPEGYRKALRLMKMAERFNMPIVTLIDTPGAYPGIDAENRGQSQAIAQNLYEMAKMTTPIISIIIGEGASGGALGIGVGNTVAMLENTWYTVISPEACSAILWRTVDHKKDAAQALKLTPQDALQLEVIEEILKEPIGGAHLDPATTAQTIKTFILKELSKFKTYTPEQLVEQRINRFNKLSKYNEVI